ncbi:MAG: hypothetical protein SVM80_13195 [Halobacteriota archaeon]|nr:hypothetical protein [Halobacteriota archaeon]
MTTTEDVERLSPFTVGSAATDTITAAELTSFELEATAELDRDDPGLDTYTYNRALALYICHMIESAKGKRDITSEKMGDYSYSKGKKTGYLLEYEELIGKWSRHLRAPSAKVERYEIADDGRPESFKLDGSDVPSFSR